MSKFLKIDFNLATPLNYSGSTGCTPIFAPSNFYLNKTRTPVDDLESLVFSMWDLVNIPMDCVNIYTELKGKKYSNRSRETRFKPEGEALAECKQKGIEEAQAKMVVS